MAEKVALAHKDQGRRWILRRSDRSVVRGDGSLALTFSKKADAKAYRDQVSQDLVVSPGPDHWKW